MRTCRVTSPAASPTASPTAAAAAHAAEPAAEDDGATLAVRGRGQLSALSVFRSKSVLYGALYGRGRRVAVENYRFRPGQEAGGISCLLPRGKFDLRVTAAVLLGTAKSQRWRVPLADISQILRLPKGDTVKLGLGCTVALCCRSSTLYKIHEHIRYVFF